jgi:cytochrome P450
MEFTEDMGRATAQIRREVEQRLAGMTDRNTIEAWMLAAALTAMVKDLLAGYPPSDRRQLIEVTKAVLDAPDPIVTLN